MDGFFSCSFCRKKAASDWLRCAGIQIRTWGKRPWRSRPSLSVGLLKEKEMLCNSIFLYIFGTFSDPCERRWKWCLLIQQQCYTSCGRLGSRVSACRSRLSSRFSTPLNFCQMIKGARTMTTPQTIANPSPLPKVNDWRSEENWTIRKPKSWEMISSAFW